MVLLKGLDLEKILPHRLEALMIDEIIYNPHKPHSAIALKKIYRDDPWLVGHFAERPIYPGHCLIELVCLTAAALIRCSLPEIKGLPIVARLGEVSFKWPALPGDNLVVQVELLDNLRGKLFTFSGKVLKNEQIICEVKNLKGIAGI